MNPGGNFISSSEIPMKYEIEIPPNSHLKKLINYVTNKIIKTLVYSAFINLIQSHIYSDVSITPYII